MDENVRNEIINDVDNHRNMEGNIPASSFDMACPGAQGIDINDDGKADSCVQASAEIEIYSQDRLKRLNKGQLIDLLMETQAKYLELFKAYTHQAEIVFRDRSIRFGSGTDSSYTAPAPEKKDESSDKEEGSHSEPKEKRPGRTSHPVRTPGFSEHRFDDIAVLEKDQKPAEKELAEYFGSHEYVFISKKEIEDYGVLPARIYLRRRLVYTYKDLQTGELHTFGSAQELKFMSGSLITPELIAYVAWEYYFNCIPVNRQVKAFGTEGVNLTKQNLYECMRKCGNAAISPIAARMRKLGLQSMKNQMDESYVVDREERENTGRRNCYMWQMRTSEMLKEGPQIISYSFVNSRSAEELNKILDGYQGKVECDGYSAYPAVMKINGGIEIACCFWHVEHYFTDVIRGIPEWNKMSEDERMRIPAYEIIKGMTDVFKEEKNLRDLSVEERRAGRMNIILPKVEKIYKTIEKHAADPMLDTNSLFGKAVTYAINRKPYVMVAVKDPELPIHNLGCERGFVRFAVLRNNIRAFSTNKGARSAADYMTVGDTCQANGRNVQTYYRYLIETIPGVMEKHKDQSQLNDLSFLDAYMPWSAGYREYEQNLREKGRNLFSELIDHNG